MLLRNILGAHSWVHATISHCMSKNFIPHCFHHLSWPRDLQACPIVTFNIIGDVCCKYIYSPAWICKFKVDDHLLESWHSIMHINAELLLNFHNHCHYNWNEAICCSLVWNHTLRSSKLIIAITLCWMKNASLKSFPNTKKDG
jgi:hypothetical protein